MTVKNSNIKNQVYATIKERLINCEYAPGSFLNETKLAEDLGCSRTPIREALSQLEFDNLIKIIPKKGIYVCDISLNDIQQIFQTRLEIEPVTLHMSYESLSPDLLYAFREKFTNETGDIPNGYKLDTAMHLCLIEHCSNRYLVEMMKKVFEDNTRVIVCSKENQEHIDEAREEHIAILDALIAKDIVRATDLMRTHIQGCRKAALDYYYDLERYASNQTPDYLKVLDEIR